MQAITTLLGSVAVWESLFQLSSKVLHHPGTIDKITLDKSTKSTLLDQGPSYIVSVVHSALLSWWGVQHLLDFLPLEEGHYHFLEDNDYAIYQKIESSNLIFLGYLIYDLYHVAILYPKLGGPDMIIHHFIFMTCCTINGYYQFFPFGFTWLILGEVSTMLLSVRWLLIKTGRGSTDIFKAVQLLFAGAFLLIRVFIYNAGVWHMGYHYRTIWDLQERVPLVVLITTISIVLAGAVLNLFWALKICKMAVSSKRAQMKQV